MTMPLEQTINTEPLLTIMGIVAAAWAIIPRTRLLQISLNLSWIDWALTGFALLLANYLTFEPLLSSFNLYYSIGPWLPGLDSASATYLIFLAWLTYACLRSRFGRLPRSNTKKLKELVDRLIATRQYDELSLIIENQLDKIIQISDEIYAHNTIQNITNNNDLTNHLSLAHPNICLKLIKADPIMPTDFSSRFIESLINNTGSQLYLELKHNKQLEHPEMTNSKRLHINDNNTLIKELLSDPHLAINHYETDRTIWRTAIYAIENNKTLVNKLNTPSDYYEEKDEYNCPINTSIAMFNIMVHEAIHKGYQDHMNIWFFYYLIKSLLNHTKDGQKYDFWTRTPIRILVERIISITMDWIIEGSYVNDSVATNYRRSLIDSDPVIGNMRLANVPEELIQHRIDGISGNDPDNLFISKKATELLNKITKEIIDSKEMSDEWKELCLDQIISKHKNIFGFLGSNDKKTREKEQQLADLMLVQIISGNYVTPEYRRQLLVYVEKLDTIDREPLHDRLCRAIEEDEARESSH